MRIATPIGLAAAAVLVGSSLAPASATIVRPITHTQTIRHHLDTNRYHAVPGRANAFIGKAVYHGQQSWVRSDRKKRSKGCIYVSYNLSGTVDIYGASSPYAMTGQLTSSLLYGWGVAASPVKKHATVYVGTYSDTIDFYTPCKGKSPTGSVTGESGYYPYGMAVGPNKTLYATAWPSNGVDYWPAPVNSGNAVTTALDANQIESYFVDADKNFLYVAGYNSSDVFIVDQCTLPSGGTMTCTTVVTVSGGFPGGVQIDASGNLIVNNQFGSETSYTCTTGSCTAGLSFTYSNGTHPLDETALALTKAANSVWGADIYYCSASYGVCGDGVQQLPVPITAGTANGGMTSPGVNNDEGLGIAVVRADSV